MQHPSMRQIGNRLPGTSTLSMPGIHSSFPGVFSPQTASYSMDLVRVQIENYPSSNAYFTTYCNMGIKSVLDGILSSHGFQENSQQVKDFKACARGQYPSVIMARSTDSGISMSEAEIDIEIEQRMNVYQ